MVRENATRKRETLYRVLQQLEDTEEDEAESSEKRSRRYNARERELAEEKLRRDAFGEYLQCAERCSRECLWNFTKCIYILYVEKYLRKPTLEDVRHVYDLHERKHGRKTTMEKQRTLGYESSRRPSTIYCGTFVEP
ncbi:hypothetical protein Tco_0103126 [Tanacetum coccineum]